LLPPRPLWKRGALLNELPARIENVETTGYAPVFDYVQGRCRSELATFPKEKVEHVHGVAPCRVAVLRTAGFAGSLDVLKLVPSPGVSPGRRSLKGRNAGITSQGRKCAVGRFCPGCLIVGNDPLWLIELLPQKSVRSGSRLFAARKWSPMPVLPWLLRRERSPT
jgi:hypothetical protein